MSAGGAACAACGSPSVFRCSRCASRPSPRARPARPPRPFPRSSDAFLPSRPFPIRRQGHQVLLARVPARGLADAPPDVRPTSGITRGHGPALDRRLPRARLARVARSVRRPIRVERRRARRRRRRGVATPAPPRSTHRRPARAPEPSPCRVPTSPRRVGALVEYETSSRRFARSPRRERGRVARPARLSPAREARHPRLGTMTRTVIDASPDANRHDTNRRATTSETATGAASPIADSDPPGRRRRPAPPSRLTEEAAPRRPRDAGGEVRTRFPSLGRSRSSAAARVAATIRALRARTAASLAALTGAMERSSAATAFGFRRRAPPTATPADDDPGAAAGPRSGANNPTPPSIHRDRSIAAPRSIASIASIASRVAEPATTPPAPSSPEAKLAAAADDPLDARSPSLRTPRPGEASARAPPLRSAAFRAAPRRPPVFVPSPPSVMGRARRLRRVRRRSPTPPRVPRRPRRVPGRPLPSPPAQKKSTTPPRDSNERRPDPSATASFDLPGDVLDLVFRALPPRSLAAFRRAWRAAADAEHLWIRPRRAATAPNFVGFEPTTSRTRRESRTVGWTTTGRRVRARIVERRRSAFSRHGDDGAAVGRGAIRPRGRAHAHVVGGAFGTRRRAHPRSCAVSGGWDGQVFAWRRVDPADGVGAEWEPLRGYTGPGGAWVSSLARDQETNRRGDTNGRVWVWRYESSVPARAWHHGGSVTNVCFVPGRARGGARAGTRAHLQRERNARGRDPRLARRASFILLHAASFVTLRWSSFADRETGARVRRGRRGRRRRGSVSRRVRSGRVGARPGTPDPRSTSNPRWSRPRRRTRTSRYGTWRRARTSRRFADTSTWCGTSARSPRRRGIARRRWSPRRAIVRFHARGSSPSRRKVTPRLLPGGAGGFDPSG